MLQALDRIRDLRFASERVGVDGNREYNTGWHTALDLYHLLTVSEIVTQAALQRKESRGAHFRDDFPEKDKQFGVFNVVVRKDADGAMQFSQETIPPMRLDLQQIIEEMK
jgi:succinate dehydrogenase / fumarate reductase, flavoprotein subunit